jgi:hypothetical protein
VKQHSTKDKEENSPVFGKLMAAVQKQHNPAGSQKKADASVQDRAARNSGEGRNPLHEGGKGAKNQNHKQNGGIGPVGLSVWKRVWAVFSVKHMCSSFLEIFCCGSSAKFNFMTLRVNGSHNSSITFTDIKYYVQILS